MKMSKIVGFEFNDHRPYPSTNKQTGEVTTKYLDNVTFYVTVPLASDEDHVYRRGVTLKEYTASKTSLEAIFNTKITNTVEFLEKALNRDCIPQTAARTFRRDGNDVLMGEELVGCFFIDELVGATKEK